MVAITRRFCAGLAALAAVVFSGGAGAQGWLSRPITVVVPFATGVSSDVMARGLAEFLTRELGQSVIVENKGGAGGNIGAAHVARSKPDGSTFLFASTGQAATNKLMYKEMGYDPDKDFAPIVLLGKLPVVIVAKKGGNFASMKELLEKSKTAASNIGFPGNGTLGHITGLLFAKTAGIQINEVQYTGSGKIIGDLMGGHIDAAMDSAGAYMGAFKDGSLVPLALAATRRSALLPETPTVSEAGMPGFEASVWYALFAPTSTPEDVIARMNAATNAYLSSDAGKALFGRLGVDVAGGSPADLKAFMAAETAKWGPVISAAKIQF